MPSGNKAAREQLLERMFFGSSRHAEGEEKVLRYVIHRINKEARLHDVIREDYVRRNCSRSEINRIINDPELVHACRERLWWTFKSGVLDPSPRRRTSQPSTDGSPADGKDVSGPASPDA